MGAQRRRVVAAGGAEVEESVTDPPMEFVARVAGLDIGKAQVMVCVRVPAEGAEEKSEEESEGTLFPAGRRRQVVREYSTVSKQLLALADWLRVERVGLVVMEATGSYWKPVYYLLEAEGLTCELVNSRHIKNLPGRPKTDLLTELRDSGFRWWRSGGSVLARFAARDQRRRATESVRVGSAAGGVA